MLRQAGGLQALRKLSAIQALSAAKKTVDRNEDQIYLISSITNNVLRRRKAWYIIEGQTGTGKGEIIKGVTDKLTENGKPVFSFTLGDFVILAKWAVKIASEAAHGQDHTARVKPCQRLLCGRSDI